MIRASDAPSARAASTNSFSRSDSTVDRTIRDTYAQVSPAITWMCRANAATAALLGAGCREVAKLATGSPELTTTRNTMNVEAIGTGMETRMRRTV